MLKSLTRDAKCVGRYEVLGMECCFVFLSCPKEPILHILKMAQGRASTHPHPFLVRVRFLESHKTTNPLFVQSSNNLKPLLVPLPPSSTTFIRKHLILVNCTHKRSTLLHLVCSRIDWNFHPPTFGFGTLYAKPLGLRYSKWAWRRRHFNPSKPLKASVIQFCRVFSSFQLPPNLATLKNYLQPYFNSFPWPSNPLTSM